MAVSFAESGFAPLVEADPARKPLGLFERSPPAMEVLEELRVKESAAPSADPATLTVLGVEMVVKNTFIEVAEEEVAAKLPRCSSAPGLLAAWSQRCLSDSPEDSNIESELSARGASSAASHSWSGHAANPVAAEDYDFEVAQFETPRRLSIAGFAMDTPVRAGGAGAPPAAAAASAGAEVTPAPQAPPKQAPQLVAAHPAAAAASAGAEVAPAPQAPPNQAPQLVTTLMVQNLNRSITRGEFMRNLDRQGFAGKYDFVHLPKSFGSTRNNGCAFVNFPRPEDAEEFACSIARVKGSKMRAVPADVQGSHNLAKATSRKKNRIRTDSCRPWVLGGRGQDTLSHA